MDITNRISKMVAHYGINLTTLSKKVGLNNSVTISKIINEKRKPSSKTVGRIIHAFPDINYDWLVNGEGDMLKSESNKETSTVNNDEMTVTASQVANFMRQYYPYSTAESEKRIVEIVKETENKIVSFLTNTYPTTPNWSYKLFEEMEAMEGRSKKINASFLKAHQSTQKDIGSLNSAVEALTKRIAGLDILMEEIEKQDLMHKLRVKKFIKSKK